jgi:hypothetical protein
MYCQAANSSFETPSLSAFPSKVRDRRTIVTALADGTTLEMNAEIEVDPERPFDVPTTITGRFSDVWQTGLILDIKDRPVALDGRRYRFAKIDKNGSFRLRKGW